MNITYEINKAVSATQFIDLLKKTNLAERRPLDDSECIKGMLDNSNLLISAWDGEHLIGVARAMTDFHYACYLSDLAVDEKDQNKGIGKHLLDLTQQQLGDKCKLILISAPSANNYYPLQNFVNNPRCWVRSF